MKKRRYHSDGTVSKIQYQNRRKMQNRYHQHTRPITFMAWYWYFDNNLLKHFNYLVPAFLYITKQNYVIIRFKEFCINSQLTYFERKINALPKEFNKCTIMSLCIFSGLTATSNKSVQYNIDQPITHPFQLRGQFVVCKDNWNCWETGIAV